MKIYSLETGILKIDGGAMFGVVPKVLWENSYPCVKDNLTYWAMRSMLIEIDEKKILIDNGIGNKQSKKFFSIYQVESENTMEKSFEKLGFSFDEITDVVLTHLHFDHCGGTVKYDENKNLTLAFPNAKHWVSEKQWNLANNPNDREKASFLKENFLAIEKFGKLNLIKKDTKIHKNIELRLFYGHTDGQIIPFIKNKDKTVVFMADLLASTAHIPMPYIPSYDTKPLIVLEEKKKFFEEAISNNYILFFQHDLYKECCTLKNTKRGVREKDFFTLKSIFN